MGIKVQSASITGTSPLSLAFPSNNGAGNLLIVVAGAQTSGKTFSLSDTQGNAFTALASFLDSSGTVEMQLFYCLSSRAGANTVTFDSTAAGANSFLAIHEFVPAMQFDVSASVTGSGGTVDSSGATTNFAAELLFGFAGGGLSPNAPISASGTWTTAEANGISPLGFVTGFLIASSSGNYHFTGTASISKGGSFTWGAEIATFRANPAVLTPRGGYGSTLGVVGGV